jgi:hypothetical protein
MKKIFLVLIMSLVFSSMYSYQWSGAINFSTYGNGTLSYYYSTSQKSMVLVIGSSAANYMIVENMNPKLYTQVKEMVTRSIDAMSVAQMGGSTVIVATGYGFVYLYNENVIKTVNNETISNQIWGIKCSAIKVCW